MLAADIGWVLPCQSDLISIGLMVGIHLRKLYVSVGPSQSEHPLEYKTHKKFLEIDARPSSNRDNTVFNKS